MFFSAIQMREQSLFRHLLGIYKHLQYLMLGKLLCKKTETVHTKLSLPYHLSYKPIPAPNHRFYVPIPDLPSERIYHIRHRRPAMLRVRFPDRFVDLLFWEKHESFYITLRHINHLRHYAFSFFFYSPKKQGKSPHKLL